MKFYSPFFLVNFILLFTSTSLLGQNIITTSPATLNRLSDGILLVCVMRCCRAMLCNTTSADCWPLIEKANYIQLCRLRNLKHTLMQLFLLIFSLNGQNLVSNGSFEDAYCSSIYIGKRFCDWVRPPQDMNTPDGLKF